MLPLRAHLPNPLIGAFLGAADAPVHLAHPDVVCRPQQRAPLQDGVRVRRVKEAGDGRVDGLVGSRRGALGRASSWFRQRHYLHTLNKSLGGKMGKGVACAVGSYLGCAEEAPSMAQRHRGRRRRDGQMRHVHARLPRTEHHDVRVLAKLPPRLELRRVQHRRHPIQARNVWYARQHVDPCAHGHGVAVPCCGLYGIVAGRDGCDSVAGGLPTDDARDAGVAADVRPQVEMRQVVAEVLHVHGRGNKVGCVQGEAKVGKGG